MRDVADCCPAGAAGARTRPSAGYACAVTSEPRPRHPAARAFNLIALAIGVVGFVFVVRELGWRGIENAVIGTGAWFVVLAAIDFVGSFFDAAAVYSLLRPQVPIAYRHVFAAQLSGMAINRLTPGNSLGEPVKVMMLVRTDVPPAAAVSAIMIFNLCTTGIAITAIAIGVPLTALMLDLPLAVARVVWIGLAVLVAFCVAVIVLLRRGALATLVRALAHLRLISPERSVRWQGAVASIDERLRGFSTLHAPGLAGAVAGALASRIFNWVGTFVILYAIDIPLTAPVVIASLSVGILVTWISNVVPLGLGLADGTNYALYGILGASPVAGLLFTMVNRLRTVVLALMGLTVMAIANAFHRRGLG